MKTRAIACRTPAELLRSDWLKGHAIDNGLFDLIISNYIDHVAYIQAVHGLVKRPQSYKIYFLEDKLSVYNIRAVYLAS